MSKHHKKPEKTKQEPQPTFPKSIISFGEGCKIVIEAKPNSKSSRIVEINEEFVGVAIAAPPKEG